VRQFSVAIVVQDRVVPVEQDFALGLGGGQAVEPDPAVGFGAAEQVGDRRAVRPFRGPAVQEIHGGTVFRDNLATKRKKRPAPPEQECGPLS
jgi:hypothetical protein